MDRHWWGGGYNRYSTYKKAGVHIHFHESIPWGWESRATVSLKYYFKESVLLKFAVAYISATGLKMAQFQVVVLPFTSTKPTSTIIISLLPAMFPQAPVGTTARSLSPGPSVSWEKPVSFSSTAHNPEAGTPPPLLKLVIDIYLLDVKPSVTGGGD